jgi:hypothetical protein
MTYVFGVWHKFPRQTSWTPQLGCGVIGINFNSDHISYFVELVPSMIWPFWRCPFKNMFFLGSFLSRIHQFWDIYLHVEYVLQIRSCRSIYPPQTDAISGVLFMFCICWRLQFWKIISWKCTYSYSAALQFHWEHIVSRWTVRTVLWTNNQTN